jgi:hypothetical protein
MKIGRIGRRRKRSTAAGLSAPIGRSLPQSAILLQILKGAALFHDPDGIAYADIKIKGHRETWKVRSLGFRDWLIGSFHRKTDGAPNNDAMQQALRVAEAKAKFNGPERRVHVRIAGRNGNIIYIDLADADWRAIKIDANGWTVVKRPAARFVRSKGMLPLPMPARGGNIDKLRDFINVKADDNFILIIAWALAALRDTGPYPVLTAIGEQGSAKSTLMEILRLLIDPNGAPLRSPPRDDRELLIAATNAHLLAYDNLSGLPSWLSDGLARISTGAAHATRQLYHDQEEVLMKAERPIALNGITDIINRADLADRCIFVTAERILDKDRKPKQELLAAFDAERPRIFGALLDAVAHGIKILPTVTTTHWPRMADFAKWATACEGAFAKAGSFLAAYQSNRTEAVDTLLDDDLVAMAVQNLRLPWEGSARQMLDALSAVTDPAHAAAKDWPKGARALSARLSRLAPLLLTKRINAYKLPRTSARRGWRIELIRAAEDKRGLASLKSSTSLANPAGGIAGDDNCAVSVTKIVTGNPLKINRSDADDARDGKSARLSGRRAVPPVDQRKSVTAVPSDIEPAYEELRERGEDASQLVPPAHQPVRRPRLRRRGMRRIGVPPAREDI